MRACVLLTSMLVIALLHALMLVPRAEPRHWNTTEEIRTSRGGHHHKAMASFTDDTDDDGDDDDADDVLANSIPVAIAPVVRPQAPSVSFTNDPALGPSTVYERLLERPPRA